MKKLELISRDQVKLERFRFKSHTLGEYIEGDIIRNLANEIVKVLDLRRERRGAYTEPLTGWEFDNASYDLKAKLENLLKV